LAQRYCIFVEVSVFRGSKIKSNMYSIACAAIGVIYFDRKAAFVNVGFKSVGHETGVLALGVYSGLL